MESIPTWLDGALVPLPKIDVHRRGLRHMAVSVFLTDGDQTLLQQRALTKYHTPGLWANSCCTHPLWGEAAIDCAKRRVFEELGIEGIRPEPVGQIEYRADVGNGMIEHEVVDVFRAPLQRTAAVRPNPDEVLNWRWTSLDELFRDVAAAPERFTPWLKIYLSDHAAQIFGNR